MEIRSALQKIENYLTVVSNLNKTILSEGTMSRDELLLMKKYLYTSIDRIEDIERSLMIDKREDKSFTPTEIVENKYTPVKEKEIVAVEETDHIEDVEATLNSEQKEEFVDMVEDIQAENKVEEVVAKVEEKQEEVKSFTLVAESTEEVKNEFSVINKIEEDITTAKENQEITNPFTLVADVEKENKIEFPVVNSVDEVVSIIEEQKEEVKPFTLVAAVDTEEKIDFPMLNKVEDVINTIVEKQEITKPFTLVAEVDTESKIEFPVVNKVDEVVANVEEQKEEVKSFTLVAESKEEEKIKFPVVNRVEEVINTTEEKQENTKPFTLVAAIETENKIDFPVINSIAEVVNNTEKQKEEVKPFTLVAQNTEENKIDFSANNKIEETSLLDKIKTEVDNITESITAKFEENKALNIIDDLVEKKKEEKSFFEHLEQKLNATPQPQLFQMFDDGKEDLHESIANNTTTNYDASKIIAETSSFSQNKESVLVAEQEVKTVVEELTPSALNEVFKSNNLVDTLVSKSTKTLSESIALNDKFIFVRELFGNQFSEYENALKHIDTLSSFTAVEQYCNNTLWNKFNWTERASAAGRFMDIIEKKYK
jgi:hypothetical protein